MRYTLVLAIAMLAAPAFADSPAEKQADAHPAAKHDLPQYEIHGHNEAGHHFSKKLDLRDPAQARELDELIQHGHVHEMHNASAPKLSKMASFSTDLGIWSLVVFLLLLFVLSKTAWPKMLAGLQMREDNIRGALEEAEKARGEAQALRASLQKDMDNAHLKVKELIDEAKRDAEVTAADVLSKARADIATDRERLQREIRTETEQAMQSLWTRAADLATQASAKALRRQLDGGTQRQLIDEALSELKMAGTNGHA